MPYLHHCARDAVQVRYRSRKARRGKKSCATAVGATATKRGRSDYDELTQITTKGLVEERDWHFSMVDMTLSMQPKALQEAASVKAQLTDLQYYQPTLSLPKRVEVAADIWKKSYPNIEAIANIGVTPATLTLEQFQALTFVAQLGLFLRRLSAVQYAAVYVAYLPWLLHCVQRAQTEEKEAGPAAAAAVVPYPLPGPTELMVIEKPDVLLAVDQQLQVRERQAEQQLIRLASLPTSIQEMADESDEMKTLLPLNTGLQLREVNLNLQRLIILESQTYAQLQGTPERFVAAVRLVIQRNDSGVSDDDRYFAAQLSALQEQLKDIRTHQLRSDVDALTEIGVLKEQVRSLQEQLRQSQELENALKSELEKKSNVESTSDQNMALARQFKARAQKELEAVNAQNETLRTQLDTARASIAALERRLEELNSARERVQTERDQRDQVLQGASEQFNDVQRQLKDQREINNRLQAERDQGSRALEEARTRFATLQQRFNEQQATTNEAKAQVAKYQQYANAFETLLQRYRIANADALNELLVRVFALASVRADTPFAEALTVLEQRAQASSQLRAAVVSLLLAHNVPNVSENTSVADLINALAIVVQLYQQAHSSVAVNNEQLQVQMQAIRQVSLERVVRLKSEWAAFVPQMSTLRVTPVPPPDEVFGTQGTATVLEYGKRLESAVGQMVTSSGGGGGGNDPTNPLFEALYAYVAMLEKAVDELVQTAFQAAVAPLLPANLKALGEVIAKGSPRVAWQWFDENTSAVRLLAPQDLAQPISLASSHPELNLLNTWNAIAVYQAWRAWNKHASTPDIHQRFDRIPEKASALLTVLRVGTQSSGVALLRSLTSAGARLLLETTNRAVVHEFKRAWKLVYDYVRVAVYTWEWADQFRTTVPGLPSTSAQSLAFDFQTVKTVEAGLKHSDLLVPIQQESQALIPVRDPTSTMALEVIRSVIAAPLPPPAASSRSSLSSSLMFLEEASPVRVGLLQGSFDESTQVALRVALGLGSSSSSSRADPGLQIHTLENTAQRYLAFLEPRIHRHEYMSYHALREPTEFTVDWRLDGNVQPNVVNILRRYGVPEVKRLPRGFYRLCGQRDQYDQQSVLHPLPVQLFGATASVALQQQIEGATPEFDTLYLRATSVSAVHWVPELLTAQHMKLLPLAPYDYLIVNCESKEHVDAYVAAYQSYRAAAKENPVFQWHLCVYLIGSQASNAFKELEKVVPSAEITNNNVHHTVVSGSFTTADLKWLAYFFHLLIYMPELEVALKDGHRVTAPILRARQEIQLAIEHTAATKKPADIAGDHYLGQMAVNWASDPDQKQKIAQWTRERAEEANGVSIVSSSFSLSSTSALQRRRR